MNGIAGELPARVLARVRRRRTSLAELARRTDAAEEAVRENHQLAVALGELVDDLERQALAVADRRLAPKAADEDA